MGKLFYTAALFIICVTALACMPSSRNNTVDKIGVVVTILPQREFVINVGRERVDVTVMVPPGADPHTYEVTPGQMAKLSSAKVYFKVGTPIEFELTWLGKLIDQNRNMFVVNCSKGIDLIASTDPSEPGVDPHIWTSPNNAKIMVNNICEGLIQIDPEYRQFYEENRDIYIKKLTDLDRDIRESLSKLKIKKFLVYHPAWGYFARDYGLEQIGIQREGKEPQAAYMARLIKEAEENNIKIIFVSPEFDARSAETIAREIKGRVVFIDPLAPDYLENMRRVAEAFREALQ